MRERGSSRVSSLIATVMVAVTLAGVFGIAMIWPYMVYFWAAAAFSGLLFMLCWSTWRDARVERRRAAGQCLHCGYDLQGSTERCPECGRVPGNGKISRG